MNRSVMGVVFQHCRRFYSMKSRGKSRVEKEIQEHEREVLQRLRRSLKEQHLKQLRHQVRKLERTKKGGARASVTRKKD
jgi:DnaJ-domain-containing protein 1